MPRNKVSGKTCKAEEGFYCPVGTVTTNKITYGAAGRKIVTKERTISKKAYRCIRNTSEGKFVDVGCHPCSAKQSCKCPQNSKVEEDRVQAVKVVEGTCPVKCHVKGCSCF